MHRLVQDANTTRKTIYKSADALRNRVLKHKQERISRGTLLQVWYITSASGKHSLR